MNRQNWTLLGTIGLGAGLGAGLMYLLDPQGGRGRRALARDKAVSKLKTGSESALKKSRHLGNRTKGLVAQASSKLRPGKKDDLASLLPTDLTEGTLDQGTLDQANRELQTILP